jgi:hypothetical protein
MLQSKTRRVIEKAMRSARMRRIPSDHWPKLGHPDEARRREVWLSQHFLAQVFLEAAGATRISVNRTAKSPDGQWIDRMTWDELHAVKAMIGRGEVTAYEIYPKDSDLVNVSNMRHLWIPKEPLTLGWRRPDDGQ